MAVTKTDRLPAGIVKWMIENAEKIDTGLAWQLRLRIYNLYNLSYLVVNWAFKMQLVIVDVQYH